jgi:hypothetical protein
MLVYRGAPATGAAVHAMVAVRRPIRIRGRVIASRLQRDEHAETTDGERGLEVTQLPISPSRPPLRQSIIDRLGEEFPDLVRETEPAHDFGEDRVGRSFRGRIGSPAPGDLVLVPLGQVAGQAASHAAVEHFLQLRYGIPPGDR